MPPKQQVRAAVKSTKSPQRAKPPGRAKPPQRAKPLQRAKPPQRAKPSPEPLEPMLKQVAFTMFPVQDATRARAFYEDVLGLTRGLASPDGVWTEYDLPGGGCVALFRHPDPAARRSPGGASLAFEVADLDALNRRLKAAGVIYEGDIVHGPHCRMSNILDSEGNAIILHELARGR